MRTKKLYKEMYYNTFFSIFYSKDVGLYAKNIQIKQKPGMAQSKFGAVCAKTVPLNKIN